MQELRSWVLHAMSCTACHLLWVECQVCFQSRLYHKSSLKGLFSVTGLRFLDVSFNQISTIPPDLARLTSLTRLNLSFNPLGEFFPIAVTGMVALKELNLDFTGEISPFHLKILSLYALLHFDNFHELNRPCVNLAPNASNTLCSPLYIHTATAAAVPCVDCYSFGCMFQAWERCRRNSASW